MPLRPILAVFLAAAPVSAEPTQATIASVRIETPPGYEAKKLAGYLDIKAGDVLEPAEIRKSVELLHATGQFEDVIVDAVTSAAGIDLLFRPIPAPLLDRVLVEGDRVTSPGNLARVTRLRRGEALWPHRLEGAAQAAALALVEEGYLEARVTAEVRRRNGATDAVFHIAAGPRARVGSIDLEGAPALAAEALRALTPRAGRVFRRGEERRALDRMRAFFVKQGHWRARSDVLETYQPDRALMDLAFRLDPGPRTTVEFRGARLPRKLQATLTGVLRDGSLGRDAIEQVRERIEETFLAQGHRDAFVSHREETREGEMVVVYVTEPGPEARVAQVRISGFDAPDLEAAIETLPLGPVVDRTLDEDASRLQKVLQAQGYAEAHVEAEVPDGGGSLAVTLLIRPGPRTLTAAVTVDAPPGGPSPLPERRCREGEPYRRSDVALDREALLTAYHNAGHLQAAVAVDTSFSEDSSEATLTFRVTPGPRVDVARIVIAGLYRTRPEVVRRELTLKEGQPLSQAGLLESQRRLSALGIFDRVTIAQIDPDSPGLRSVVVTAEEAAPTTVAYGLGYAEQDRLRGSFEVTRRNLLGMNRTLTLFARASLEGNSRAFVTVREPYLLGHRLDLFATGFHEEGTREGFDFTRSGGLLQTAFHAGSHAGLIVRFSYQQTHLFNVTIPPDEIDRQFQDSTSSGPSVSFVDDTRDDPLEPRRGRFVAGDLQLSSAVFGGDSFVKSSLQGSAFRRIVPRVVLAVSGRLGLAWTLQAAAPSRLPLPDRFFAGGDNSIRGFPLDGVGPQEVSTTGVVVPTGGNALLIGSAELRIDTGHRVSLAVFSDSGNVYPLVSDMTLGDIRYVAGVGLRYRSALGPFRLDWGYKLNRRPNESPGHIHVTIGHAF